MIDAVLRVRSVVPDGDSAVMQLRLRLIILRVPTQMGHFAMLLLARVG